MPTQTENCIPIEIPNNSNYKSNGVYDTVNYHNGLCAGLIWAKSKYVCVCVCALCSKRRRKKERIAYMIWKCWLIAIHVFISSLVYSFILKTKIDNSKIKSWVSLNELNLCKINAYLYTYSKWSIYLMLHGHKSLNIYLNFVIFLLFISTLSFIFFLFFPFFSLVFYFHLFLMFYF